MPSFDPSISLGNLIALGGFLVSLVTLHVSNVKRLEVMSTKLDIIFEWWRNREKERQNREEKS